MNAASTKSGVGRKTRLARRIALAGVTLAVLACADKALAPHAAGSRKIMLQIAAMNIPPSRQQQPATPKYLLGIVGYATSKDTVILGYAFAPITGSSAQVSVSADLTTCLADPTRLGSRSACSILVAVVLTDSTFKTDSSGQGGGSGGNGNEPFALAYDYAIVGPFDAAPGVAPTIPPIDLSTTRFTTHEWTPDAALMLGGVYAPSQFGSGGGVTGLSGYVNGSSPPTLFAISRDSFGFPAIAKFDGQAWSVMANQALAANLSSTGQQVNFAPYNGLAVLSPTEIWLASGSGIWRFDGTNYTQVGGNTSTLNFIAAWNSGGTGRLILAVGPNGTVVQSNGTSNQSVSLGSNEGLTGVCITGPTEAFVSGGGGTLWRFDGTSWTATSSAVSGPKVGLVCAAPGKAFVIAQGTNGNTVLGWNGSSWTALPTTGLNGRSIRGLGAASASELYAFADSASTVRTFLRFNGTSWQAVGTSAFTNAAPTTMWADPRGGSAYVLASFARLEMASPSGVSVLSYVPDLRDVSMNSPTSAFAVGWNALLARWDGQAWTVDRPPAGTSTIRVLNAVWSDGPANGWAVGAGADILHWNGSGWTVISDAVHPIDAAVPTFNGVWGNAGTVIVAGSSGIIRCTGAVCVHDAVPGTGTLYGVWGTSASNVFAVGAGGTILHYSGSAWNAMTSGTSRTLVRVWGSSATNVYALGDSTLLHYDGTAWTSIPMTGDLADAQSSTAPQNLQTVFQLGLWGAGPNEVYVGGDYGSLVRWDGTGWRHVTESNGGRRVVGISGVPGFGAMAVTEAQSPWPVPTVWRGVSAAGGMATPMTPPTGWP